MCSIQESYHGPIFFESTVNSDRYIKGIFVPFSEHFTVLEKQKTWFQQDGATAHTVRATMTAVRKVFGERVISRDLWPPCSPDLTPPDFYLRGKLKGFVYADNPRSINDLKHNIRQVIADIRCEELHQVFSNLRRRVELCLQEDGSHFQQLL